MSIEMMSKMNGQKKHNNKQQHHQPNNNGKSSSSSSATRQRKKQSKSQPIGFHADEDNTYIDDDELEATSLLGSSIGHNDEDDDDSIIEEGYRSNRFMIRVMVIVLIMASLALFVPGIFSKSTNFESLRKPARLPVQYNCPKPEQIDKAGNWDPSFESDYVDVSKSITDNMTEFLETFHDSKFDDWGKPYEVVRNGMFHWKSTKYPKYLKDGDTIYESACGIGLNLYMTLDILHEVKGIENLFVYGNEYVDVSAYKAEAVFDNIAPANGQKGVICPGDSGNLYFVPNNSFDLVFTGYISPILDPLHFNFPERNDAYKRLDVLCAAEKTAKNRTTNNSGVEEEEDDITIWEGQKLSEIAQQRQNDWYGNWIKEMVRIAKPGVPVIVEQVSYPYCYAKYDWGGVSQEWFLDAVHNNTYDWNVQPDSIEFERDTIFHNRYHAFMLKK